MELQTKAKFFGRAFDGMVLALALTIFVLAYLGMQWLGVLIVTVLAGATYATFLAYRVHLARWKQKVLHDMFAGVQSDLLAALKRHAEADPPAGREHADGAAPLH